MQLLRPKSQRPQIREDVRGLNRTLGRRQVVNTRRQSFSAFNRATPAMIVAASGDSSSVPKMRIAVFFLIILAGIAVIWNSLVMQNAVVIIANPGKSSLRSPDEYQRIAREALKGSWKNRTKYTVDRQSIVKTLAKQLPEAESISVEPALFGQAIEVNMIIDTPVLVLQTASQKAILGTSGKMITMANADNIAKLPAVIDQSGLEPSMGNLVLGSETVSRLLSFLEDNTNSQLKISQAILPPAAYELDVRYEGSPYIVKYNLQRDMREQLGSYLAVRKKLAGEGKVPSEYIDVRVEERVYYK